MPLFRYRLRERALFLNLPHWITLSAAEVPALPLVADDQHSAWRWIGVDEAVLDPEVHPYVRPYAEWLAREFAGPSHRNA